LRSQSVPRSEGAGLELAGMALNLVSMLVNAAKVVGAAVDVENHTARFLAFPLVEVLAHLDTVGFENIVIAPPLPPIGPANFGYAFQAQLLDQMASGNGREMLRNIYVLHPDPVQNRNRL